MKYIYLINKFHLKEKTKPLINRLEDLSKQYNRDYSIEIIETVQDFSKVMDKYENNKDIITAIGGDGSINHVLNSIINTENILSYIPYGTGNDFSRANIETLEDGIHEIDVVRINDKYFINVACFGIDADIANDDRYIRNNLIPKSMRYNAGVIHHFLTYKPKKIKIEIDDQTFEDQYTTVVVANNRYYGGGYKVSPLSDIKDGKMELIICDKLGKINMAKTILSMKDGGHLNNPHIKLMDATKLTISSDTPLSGNIDGEEICDTKYEIELLPAKLKIETNKSFIQQF